MVGCQPRFAGMRWRDGTDTGDRSVTSTTCAARIRALATDSDSRRLLPHPKGLRVDAEHRPASAVGSISNIAHVCATRAPCSCGNATGWGTAVRGGVRLKIDVERIVDSIRAAIESTRAANRTSRAGAESNNCRSSVVPPAGFEPALPPPEAGPCLPPELPGPCIRQPWRRRAVGPNRSPSAPAFRLAVTALEPCCRTLPRGVAPAEQ